MREKFNINDLIVEKKTGNVFRVLEVDSEKDGYEYLLLGENEGDFGYYYDESEFIKLNLKGTLILHSDNTDSVESEARAAAASYLAKSDLYGKEYYELEDSLTSFLNRDHFNVPILGKNTLEIRAGIEFELMVLNTDKNLISNEEFDNLDIRELAFEKISEDLDGREISGNFNFKKYACEAVSYERYLNIWNEEHSTPEYEGQEPACFDEFIDSVYCDNKCKKDYNFISWNE